MIFSKEIIDGYEIEIEATQENEGYSICFKINKDGEELASQIYGLYAETSLELAKQIIVYTYTSDEEIKGYALLMKQLRKVIPGWEKGEKIMSIWREYLDYSGICSFEEGKCPCDEGYECTRCLDDDVYRNFLVFKKKRNLK